MPMPMNQEVKLKDKLFNIGYNPLYILDMIIKFKPKALDRTSGTISPSGGLYILSYDYTYM